MQQLDRRSMKGLFSHDEEMVLTVMVYKALENPGLVLKHRKFTRRIEAMLLSEQDVESRLDVSLLQ